MEQANLLLVLFACCGGLYTEVVHMEYARAKSNRTQWNTSPCEN